MPWRLFCAAKIRKKLISAKAKFNASAVFTALRRCVKAGLHRRLSLTNSRLMKRCRAPIAICPAWSLRLFRLTNRRKVLPRVTGVRVQSLFSVPLPVRLIASSSMFRARILRLPTAVLSVLPVKVKPRY